jgi:hypothetical protein
MHNVNGTYITVNCLSHWFDQLATMVLEHYDLPIYEGTVFVLGGHTLEWDTYVQRHPGKKFIYYQTEQLFRNGNQTGWWNIDLMVRRLKEAKEYGAVFWDIDFMNAQFLEWEGISVDKIVPIPYTVEWEELHNKDVPDIDVLFYGSLNKRRCDVLSPLVNSLYHDKIVTMVIAGGDFHRLKEYIERAKIVLNIHTTMPFNRQEQTRIAYLLNNRKCVLSEPSQHNYYGEGIVESDNLKNSIRMLLKDEEYRKQGQKGYNIFKNLGNPPLKSQSKL